MAVEALTQFPRSFISGDTVRVTISDGDYPSSLWSLVVYLIGTAVDDFTASQISGDQFELVIPANDSDDILPGTKRVVFTYTETSSSEKQSVEMGKTYVYADPSESPTATQAQTTLAAMKTALASLAAGTTSTVNFNGQSFTRKNLKDLQDAIDRQQQIVDRELAEADLIAGKQRSRGIGIRFANP